MAQSIDSKQNSGEAETFTVADAINKIGCGPFQYGLILLSGLAWIADAFEIIILSIIGQIISCDWKLYRWQISLLTAMVFFGMILGSPFFGVIADKFGRKVAVIVCNVMVFVFGCLSAAAPSYYYMLALRTITGFALGGIPQALTICLEYFPTNIRGRAGFCLCYFWAVGTVGVILLSWVVMIKLNNWKILLVLASVPALVFLLTMKWFPESVNYYVVCNKYERAENILNSVAKTNKKDLPPGTLSPFTRCEHRGRLRDLFAPEYWKSTVILWYACMASAFTYYGIAFMSPTIIQEGNTYAIQNQTKTVFESAVEIEPCIALTNQNYIDLLWTSTAEFPGVVLFSYLVEKCNRKVLMSSSCIISSILVYLLLIDVGRTGLLIFLFAARGVVLALFQLSYVMTSEAYPTPFRAIALGAGSASARLGGVTSSYVSQVLMATNPVATIIILGTVILIAGIAAIFLPIETRGKNLSDTSDDEKKSVQASSNEKVLDSSSHL